MLYDEFLQGTGCRDNADNFKVYKDLEILYMNSDLTKQEIYEYGKKLVNNGLTAQQTEWNAEIDRQVANLKKQVDVLNADIVRYKGNYEYYKEICWNDLAEDWKREIKLTKRDIKRAKDRIKELKSCKYI